MSIDQFEAATDDGSFTDETYGSVSSGTTAPTVSYVNEAGVPEDIIDDLKGNREIASVIEKWSQSLSGNNNYDSVDMFNRKRWDDSKHVFAQMSQCAWVVENDDVLSTLADVIEGLMFQKCRFELYDEDQQDFWNQWAGDIDLDSRLRELNRELFKVSQFYVGVWWDRRVYSVRDSLIQDTIDEFKTMEREKRDREARLAAHLQGLPEPPPLPEETDVKKGGNRKRKKKFPVEVPTALTIFEPTKVLPVGMLTFGRERLAYVATREEDDVFGQVLNGDVVDGTILQLIERKYEPKAADKAAAAELGVDSSRLWLFKEDACFRHTLTRAHYERFATVRLKSILPLLDIKHHLRNSDRATLIGNTNFIVVITKGSDKLPAKPSEITNLQEQARVIARLPVLVGDHRLKVEIVAPATDNTLIESRWQVPDSRLVFKALGTFTPVVQGGNSSGTGVSEMSRVVSNGMMSRRHMLVRSLERHLFREILRRNEGVLDEAPALEFTPKRITLDFSADVITQILKVRDRGDISRETMLEELGYDQEAEVLRRARERALYDDVFNSATPHAGIGQQPFQPGQPGQPGNVGPNGQPRTEGGRPAGQVEEKPRQAKTPAKAQEEA